MKELEFNKSDIVYSMASKPTRTRFVLAMPFRKRIWRILMLIIKGWCYWD